ncbi:uncharacterized protein LY89DRAFT_762712 [Mollisia scopiformis]|uniref:G-protein coupled receptors family 1 profile domain-containing protein n=1 Tax=Mollisia scopiformis TaxID=149040 RepID=A0A194XQZ1_MOLSC|nr:uncharacterized protein LY89DRAFT_762712 [Mollisia scopiformis]KUJ22474.1 hypothetical protein LY89DRAFT_762712 [Mollisia scopiformis]
MAAPIPLAMVPSTTSFPTLHHLGNSSSGNFSSCNATSLQPSTLFFTGFQAGHIIYMIAALAGVIVSNACLAIRLASIKETRSLLKLALVHIIVIIIYALGCIFCMSACLLYFGHTIYNQSSCEGAIFLGLVFYLGQKAFLYLFLVERTHSVQKKVLTRLQDKIYLSGLAMVLVGFTGIVVTTFFYHVAVYNTDQRVCHIGLTRQIASVFLTWDIFVNIFLTAVFLKRCGPYMSRGYLHTFVTPAIKGTLEKLTFFRYAFAAEQEQSMGIQQKALVKVIQKAVWGCLALVPSTVINFALLIYFAGRQQAWFFFTFATLGQFPQSRKSFPTLTALDVTWAVLVIHWLTNSPHGMSSQPPTSERLRRTPSIELLQVPPSPAAGDHLVVKCRCRRTLSV